MRAHVIIILAVTGLSAGSAAGHGIGHHPPQPAAGLPTMDQQQGPVDRVRALVAAYHRTGNDDLLLEGWAVLTPHLAAAADARTLVAAAWLAQARHRFGLALDYLDRAVALRPDHGEAWLLRASVALVAGDPAASRAACAEAALAAPPAVVTACFSRAAAAGASSDAAADVYQRLRTVLGTQPPDDPDLLGWVDGVAADIAMRGGLPRAAEGHFRRAVALAPTTSVRAAYADLLLSRGQARRVLTLVTPTDRAPALVLRRLLALKQVEGQAPAQELADLDVLFRRWLDEGDLQHAREMGLFYLRLLPQPELAYCLARDNYRAQREPEDLALLCAAAKAVDRAEVVCASHGAGAPLSGWI